jgi:hypothetical protein
MKSMIGSIAAAGLMTAAAVLASPAHADGCYMPNCYGAMAWTPTTRNVHVSANVDSQADADAHAVALCNREQNVSNCRVVVRLAGAGCMSATDTGSGGTGATQVAANSAALRGGGRLFPDELANTNSPISASVNCNG